METAQISLLSNSKIKVDCPEDIKRELSEAFTFFVPGYKFSPKFKARVWDGKIRLFAFGQSTTATGLLPRVVKMITDRGYSVSLSPELVTVFNDYSITQEWFSDFVQTIPTSSGGTPITPRDYQYRMCYLAAKNKRQVFLSATATGKSMSQYLITRFYQQAFEEKVLIIVPSINLVEQLFSDFKDYAEFDDNWHIEENVDRLYSDYQLTNKNQVLISTWQSLLPIVKRVKSKYIEESAVATNFFKQFKAVIVDECHGAKGSSLQDILSACTNANYRVGLTGTLDHSETNELVIIGSLGPVVKIQSAKQAMDSNHIAKANISCIELLYPDDTKTLTQEVRHFNGKRVTKKISYQRETSFICGYDKRNRFILNLAKSLVGNTLILFSRIEEHGDILDNLFRSELIGRPIHYIHGGVDASDREAMRYIVETQDNAVILASYGTMSVGTNIKKINNIVFASPSKSVIRVLQSLGRGLRLSSGKTECKLYDIIDNFNNTEPNYAKVHADIRFSIYTEQSLQYKISMINL